MATEIDSILQELSELKTFATERVAAGLQPMQQEIERMKESFIKIQSDLTTLRKNRLSSMGDDGRLMVTEGRLVGFDMVDLAIMDALLSRAYSSENHGRPWPEDHPHYVRIMEARKNIVDQVSPESLFAWSDRGVKQKRVAYGYSDYNPGLRMFESDIGAWRAQMTDMQQKALDSTTATAGDELVSTIEAAQLWMDVNLDTVVLPLMQQVPMPSNPYQYPLQFGSLNWYPIAENIQALTTTPATNRVTMTAYGLKTGVPFSDELEEDAVIAFVPELRRELSRSASEIIDDVLLNADTTATNNINSDASTIATNTAGKAQWLLGFDGLIHLPLVDNTSQAYKATAAPSADIANNILTKLGKYASPQRRGEVVYISDVETAIRSLSITEYETVDVAGTRATLSTGEILNIYGKPYVHSNQMKVADETDGKITSGGNTTNTGRLLVMNTSQWRVGFRRQITMEAEREAGKGQTTLYTSLRIALTERSGTRSSATHTALAYAIRYL